MSDQNIYWGETHDNVCQRPECPVTLEQNFAYAEELLDFYAPALYVSDHKFVAAVDGTSYNGSPATIVFEFESDAADPMAVDIGGMNLRTSVAELCERSHMLRDVDASRRLLETRFGVDLDGLERPIYGQFYAHRAKLHRCIPEAGYTASFTFIDDAPLSREANYRIRVEQRNGQRAWSSPVWVAKP